MVRLGHIQYSNCFPVHALLLDRSPPAGVELVVGTPTELNAELAAGRIDVAPASSIEYARHAGRYRILPDLAIASNGPVGSILLERDRPLAALHDVDIALPTASATSIVLLRLLLEERLGLRPRYHFFDQRAGRDPFEDGAAAALWIGDAALRRAGTTGLELTDLGAEWTEWTGLPFVYAVWQAAAPPARDAELFPLHALLLESRAYFEANAAVLARRHAGRFGVEPAALLAYWRSLDYRLDPCMQSGLLHFFRLAERLREAPPVNGLRWLSPPNG